MAYAASQPDVSDQLYIEVSALSSLDYFWDHQEGLRLAGEALGVKTEYVGPAEYDMAAMVTAFELAIAKKPDGILVIGFEDSLSAVVDKAVDAGIPVVTLDADLVGSKRVCFVGTGNVNAGYEEGKKLCELIGGDGKIAIATKPGQPNLEERCAGIQKAIDEYPGVEMVQIIDTQSDAAVAAQATAAILQKYPDLAGIATVEAGGGAGVATAVEEAGKAGQIKIVTFDRGDVLEKVKKGVVSASIVQNTQLMPYFGMQVLFAIRNGRFTICNDSEQAGIVSAPVNIDTGIVIVDQDNVDLFMRK